MGLRKGVRRPVGLTLLTALPGALLTALLTALSALLPATIGPSVHAQGEGFFSASEVAQILSHGPWPPTSAPVRDPTNRFSGDARAIAVGRRLFSEATLSGSGEVSCATCHDPSRFFVDGRKRARGVGEHDRNTQTLFDVGLHRWFGWDGGADSLWAASLRPLLSPVEMQGDVTKIARTLRGAIARDESFASVFRASNEDLTLVVDAGKAIAAFVETLRSPRTPFDEFRDALAAGDRQRAALYPQDARRGLKIFLGRGNCAVCHFGPNFTHCYFHDIGRPFMPAPGRVDPGRHAGIRRLQADPFNLLGRYNDEQVAPDPRPGARDESTALKTRTVALQHRNWGEWKVPSLRGLAQTAPYMHDGSLATLREVLKHYSEIDEERLHADGENLLKPLRLTESELSDLEKFLLTLSR